MKTYQVPTTKERKPIVSYQLWQHGQLITEHRSPSYLNWFKQQHQLTGAHIRAIR